MSAYFRLAMDLLSSFEIFWPAQIPRVENTHVDALLKLASSKYFELLTIVPIEHLTDVSTVKEEL